MIIRLASTNDAPGIVGYALGARLEEEPYDCELVALHVRGDAQGQGTGRNLIAAIASHYAAQGYRSLVLWTLAANRPARALYERLGGRLVDHRQFELDEMTAFEEVAYGWSAITDLLVASRDSLETPHAHPRHHQWR
jgi:ribosomal protein S18 acetylase RimI-like enzyme